MESAIKAQTITCPECGYEFELTEAISKKFDEAAANKYQELYRTNLKEAEKKAKDSARKEVEVKYSGQIESLANPVEEISETDDLPFSYKEIINGHFTRRKK